ncbi:putative glucan 1,3-beta-glucosidase [Medicago truncatula]|uniref:Putative glucan 1,3-beta-glucosidase n=1 Tax=Medicago truncatula TaxID=3880 RepID=A0A396HU65_MEDTR|nr:putative glucan 1,3-beta-glucosidase [Medicago truncatula]
MLPLNAIQTWNHVFSWRPVNDHWSSFIVEDDFKFIARNGLNAVRIPVGWWIASDPTPPWPSNCSIECLDRHFLYTKNPSLYAVELLNEPLSLQV